MSYITHDYRCEDCFITVTEMVERSEVPESIGCSECLGNMTRQWVAQIARVSYPDGTTDRFRFARDKRALDKIARKAKKKGDLDTWMEAKKEVAEVRRASKTEKQASNICKVSIKE